MFNLDLIEQDWKNNSFRLSEKEIIEIYRSEGTTISKFEEEMNEYHRKINNGIPKFSAEEKLLRAIYGEDLIEQEQKNKRMEETPKPQKKHLSQESQKKVIEGCLYMVFDETRWWYNFFEEKLSIERIYYICLEALMNSTKYIVHCEKPVFRFYVAKSIERNIIKYVAKYLHVSYREVYEMIHFERTLDKNLKFLFDYEEKEKPEKPSKIYYQLKNECYDINYIKNISSNEFMKDYNIALENLDEIEKIVMQLLFDNNGYDGLTNKEIAEYLGLDTSKIPTIRKRAIKNIRKNEKLKTYLN